MEREAQNRSGQYVQEVRQQEEADCMKDMKKKNGQTAEELSTEQTGLQEHVSETWAEETIADLDDFIESQGIYIRQ